MAYMKTLYTTTAIATGDGRNGHVQTTDGILATDVRMPAELGGPGGSTNPEQLFAAGYAACFHSALKRVAGADGVDATDSEVVADVSLGALENGSFQLAVALEVTIPGAERDVAEKVVARAHEVCPYSNATRGNIEVVLTVA
ncbi:MAG: organic hydroperoxide resistance protein [Nocardioides sp.]|uniref:organic hydroperoxide resistance protein n=1 Tax=Nocardioides sp. TaxID=35761 RepID=UPI00326649C9